MLSVLLVAGCLAAVSGTASAGYYCNILVAANSQCSGNSGIARWSSNVAQYIGAGTVSVCEKTTWATSGPDNGYVLSRICANNTAISSAADGWSWLGYNELNFVGNNSGSAHTILGGSDPYSGFAARRSNGSQTATAAVTGATVAPSTVAADVRSQLGVLRTAPASGKIPTITGPGDQVSLRTTRDRLCLDSGLAGGEITCQDHELAAEGYLLAATVCGLDQPREDIVVYGVVPDGVSAVQVETAEGSELGQAAVTSNTFRIQLSKLDAASADHLNWVGRDGSVPLGVIPDDLGC
ncbi:hypothetical protein [Conexibacter sp. CPCC 206217]|uniref:hypothetical protein n=1 Tax=Conexibacter sp. CPCC 206217 TaxID=3064574 RepID=UPI00272297DB|nr:hypothetical protein [Conexibacter sp. CPCC 206217]MDO8209662.1 hypothetical protein [Conexibacter sp. CPCC 206217]